MWDYRIIKSKQKDGSDLYSIAEVYFKDDGKPWGFVEADGSFLIWETVKELEENIDWFKEAFNKPILRENEDGTLTE